MGNFLVAKNAVLIYRGRRVSGRARNMSGSSTFVFFVLFLSGSTNQSRPKFSGPSNFAKNVFWPVLIIAGPGDCKYKLCVFEIISSERTFAFYLFPWRGDIIPKCIYRALISVHRNSPPNL